MHGLFQFFQTTRFTKMRVLLLSFLVIGLGLTVTQYSQAFQSFMVNSVRAVLGGTADVRLDPGTTTFASGVAQTVNLQANTNDIPVNGFQVIATIEGNLPSDLSFVAPSVPGLIVLFDDLTVTSATQADLKLVYLTSSPLTPYSNSSYVNIGQLNFTPQTQGGSFTFNFVTQGIQLTKIDAKETSQNIVAYPNGSSFTYSVLAPSPSPTLTPSPMGTASPSPSGTSSPTPSVTPTLSPSSSPTPIASATSSPTPSGTPSQTPISTPGVSPTSSPTSVPTPTVMASATVKPSPRVVDPKVEAFRIKFRQLLLKFRNRTLFRNLNDR